MTREEKIQSLLILLRDYKRLYADYVNIRRRVLESHIIYPEDKIKVLDARIDECQEQWGSYFKDLNALVGKKAMKMWIDFNYYSK